MKMRYVFGLLLSVMSVSSIQAMDELLGISTLSTGAIFSEWEVLAKEISSGALAEFAPAAGISERKRLARSLYAVVSEVKTFSLEKDPMSYYRAVQNRVCDIEQSLKVLTRGKREVCNGVQVDGFFKAWSFFKSTLTPAGSASHFAPFGDSHLQKTSAIALANLIKLMAFLSQKDGGKECEAPEFGLIGNYTERACSIVSGVADSAHYPGDHFGLLVPSTVAGRMLKLLERA